MKVIQGDLSRQMVDAIVNAASPDLMGGGGVDGAIHRAAGPELQVACAQLGGCATGEAKITPGFGLFAEYVIHTVGPVWQEGEQQQGLLLSGCYASSLDIASGRRLGTIAFPAISTGAYGYPFEEAARIALVTTAYFLARHHYPKQVDFVLYTAVDYRRFGKVFQEVFGDVFWG